MRFCETLLLRIGYLGLPELGQNSGLQMPLQDICQQTPPQQERGGWWETLVAAAQARAAAQVVNRRPQYVSAFLKGQHNAT